jgi:hypothetical protein
VQVLWKNLAKRKLAVTVAAGAGVQKFIQQQVQKNPQLF